MMMMMMMMIVIMIVVPLVLAVFLTGLLGADDGLSYRWGSFKPSTGAFKKGATLFDINVYSSLPRDDDDDE